MRAVLFLSKLLDHCDVSSTRSYPVRERVGRRLLTPTLQSCSHEVTSVKVLAAVTISGGVGTALRYLVGVGVLRAGITTVPIGTLAVNVFGSLALGFLARYFAPPHGSTTLFAALTVGLCGGFTTFSTFALDLFGMVERNQATRAAIYAVSSVLLSYLALALGFIIARALRP